MDHVEVHKHFDPACVAYSYGLACLGSLTAVVIMDCRRQVSNPMHQRLLLVAAAVALGGCGIWAMHFMGMTALKLKDGSGREYPVSFEPLETVASLLAAVVFVYAGLEVASRDQYFGKDSEQRVAALTHDIGKKDLKSVKKGGKALVEFQALYAHLHWLLAGGVLAATGVCMMHYGGMSAMRSDLHREWRISIIIISVVIAVTAASAAFWILFRVLEWKPHLNYLRLAAALIMGVAVCGMHYCGTMPCLTVFITCLTQPYVEDKLEGPLASVCRGMHAAKYTTWTGSSGRVLPGADGGIITKWAVAAEVVYCVMCNFFCYAKARDGERALTRGVDQLFKSLSAASCEVAMNTHKAGTSTSIGRSASSRGASSAAVSSAEREKALAYVSQTLRFVLAHNTKNRDADLEAVDTELMFLLRAGSVVAQPRRSTGPLSAPGSPAPLVVDSLNSAGGEPTPRSLTLRPKVHPSPPVEKTGSLRFKLPEPPGSTAAGPQVGDVEAPVVSTEEAQPLHSARLIPAPDVPSPLSPLLTPPTRPTLPPLQGRESMSKRLSQDPSDIPTERLGVSEDRRLSSGQQSGEAASDQDVAHAV